MVMIPTARFVVTCPAGCDADFQPTDVALPEGQLLACRRWDYFHVGRYGGHISFFTPRSLERLADRCGFRIERLERRRVRFAESFQTSRALYRSLKIVAEVLNVPAMWCRKGHDMLALLRKV
jgi:hypothetical protein